MQDAPAVDEVERLLPKREPEDVGLEEMDVPAIVQVRVRGVDGSAEVDRYDTPTVVQHDLAEPAEAGAGIEHELPFEAVQREVDALPELVLQIAEAREALEVSGPERCPFERERICVRVALHEPRDGVHDWKSVAVRAGELPLRDLVSVHLLVTELQLPLAVGAHEHFHQFAPHNVSRATTAKIHGMCGIGVTFDSEGRGPGGSLGAAVHAPPRSRRRGCPRASGEDGVVLEHCRLAIIDPGNPEADQPFMDPTGRWVLVYNGELFNFRELRAAIERRGVRFRTNSDTEVVLQSFIADGEQALSGFRGMFAFVIWDRETNELTAVARPGRGQAALLQLRRWPLHRGERDADDARPSGRAPPARPRRRRRVPRLRLHARRADADRGRQEARARARAAAARRAARKVEYWDALPPDAPRPPSQKKGADRQAELEDELVALLDESVSAAMVSDVPVSLMLSGGLDSSAVAALGARTVTPSELTAYSVSFGLESDESAAAARLAADLGIRHRELVLTPSDLRDSFEAWLDGHGRPFREPDERRDLPHRPCRPRGRHEGPSVR